ncbi:MAG: pyrroloquinoline quinone biosynthesis protein PqqB [Acidobacteria bacterium]|nr:pyrroloquinoline quinone biosynthesis protein PqqB [Acidobacteriota bacterium]
MNRLPFLALILLFAASCASKPVTDPDGPPAVPYVVVLGIVQDGGYPQAGCNRPHCERGWDDHSLRREVASLGIVDPISNQKWLVDATPDFPTQLRRIDELAASSPLSGIFLTHAHIGNYTGLMHLGGEVMGADSIPVYAMPRMRDFLRKNAPWSQLVELENIEIKPLQPNVSVRLNERLTITPVPVPHRDELSETVAYLVQGPSRAVFYLPDIDKWERWETPVEAIIERVAVAYLDGTFYDIGELPGRDMALIPHPFIVESIERFSTLAPEIRQRVRLIHLNHSNPALDPASPARRAIVAAGMSVAEQGEIVPLDN